MDRFKRVSYRYDLISGNVNEVAYQSGESDAFYHRYFYDAENRMASAKTSRDAFYWETDVQYRYYRHGPLERVMLGQLGNQGIDYSYILQGWLKGVNSTSLNPMHDMGNDGNTSGGNTMVSRDIFGFGLHYYDDNGDEMDYKAIGGGMGIFARPNNSTHFTSLYNGNIAAMTVNNGGLTKGVFGTTNALPLMYNYLYDQLNRLVAMRAYRGLNEATNSWTPIAIDDYQEAISYDANGNIKTYARNGASSIVGKPTAMDNLVYHYDAGTNQLNHVTDSVSTGNYTEDIDGQSIDNYGYDVIGNLIKDVSEGITDINWTVYGKIASITKNGNTINYTYDASGNRITKMVDEKITLYVRDGRGNVMSVYEVPAVNTIIQKELHLYGSNRLGMILPESSTPDNSITLTSGFGNAITRTLVRGEKLFELYNHLGNVLTTITDKKIQIPKTSPNQIYIDYYTADVVTASDYAPFGMQLLGRDYSTYNNRYRYGFNGKEIDNEINGEGNQYDYGFRIYNPRLGRFLSIDPLTHVYPWYTPYQFAGNNPIWAIDLDGLEEQKVNENTGPSNPNDEVFRGGEVGSEANVEIKPKQSFWKRAWNFTKNEILPRAVGGLKTVGGALMVTAGAALSEFGIGVPIAMYGADLAASGVQQVWDGKHHKTLTQRSFEAAGVDEKSAATMDAAIGGWAGVETNILMSSRGNVYPSEESKVESGGGRIFNHFTNQEGVSGITGVTAKKLNRLEVGESISVNQLKFGAGTNSFMANKPGDIFVTELGVNASSGQLNQIGVFADRQKFVISFSEEAAFLQGVKVSGANPARSIYTIPKNTNLKGTFTITRIQ